MRKTICIVSSVGGHLSEARMFLRAYGRYDHFYVLNDSVSLPDDMVGRTYIIVHAERDWRVLKNCYEAWSILKTRRPDLIFSTGAGPAVPFVIVGRLLGIPSVFVESAAQVATPSLTGRLIARFCARVFYQWPNLSAFYPQGTYGGPAAWSSEP